ncbi:MAG: DUF3445 domain-containing protein [Gammaproteobacteria bacterium]|nr:DUF3445 domain-containing protein [Gammaproteobacteria bacterium]
MSNYPLGDGVAPYIPEQSRDIRHMGIRQVEQAHWLAPHPAAEHYLANKTQQRICLGDKVHACIEGYEPSLVTVVRYMLDHLAKVHRRSVAITADEPLDAFWQLSLACIEDICVIDLSAAQPMFVAGSLCAPTLWRLEEKLGTSLLALHQPVPAYADMLGRQVDQFFLRLKPGRVFQRYNYGLSKSEALCQRQPSEGCFEFWRTEQQSLVRVPNSDLALFTIRVQVHHHTQLTEAQWQQVQGMMAAQPEDIRRYKGMATD